MIFDRLAQTRATLASEYPVLGLALGAHRTTRGGPIEFSSRPYLAELYADARDLRDVAIQKAVQTGISEWLVQVLFDSAGWRGRICAYVLPTYTIRNRFVQQRVNPLLLTVPAYRDRCPGGSVAEAAEKGPGNLALKRFGQGALMFLGSETKTDFLEFSADLLIIDEFDASNTSNIALAVDRLRESPFPQRILCGNPTRPKVGICSEYDDSDGRRWYHRCGHCGERQPLDWFKHVVERADDGRWVPRSRTTPIRPLCRRCHEPFERDGIGGRWVAERPDHPRRGYHLSRLDILDEDIAALLIEWRRAQGDPDLVKAFHTSILGQGHDYAGTRLTVEMLEAVSRDQPEMDRDGGDEYEGQVVTAGIDVGSVLHVVISTVGRDAEEHPVRRARLVTTAPTFEEVGRLLRRYHVTLAVMDAMPETHKAQELRDIFIDEGGPVLWLATFHPTPRVGSQRYGMRLDYQARAVQVDRTAVFDVSHQDIVDKRRLFPGDVWSVAGWAEQMQAPARVVDEDRGRVVWTEGSKADHYRLADVYDRMAADMLDLGGSYSSG